MEATVLLQARPADYTLVEGAIKDAVAEYTAATGASIQVGIDHEHPLSPQR